MGRDQTNTKQSEINEMLSYMELSEREFRGGQGQCEFEEMDEGEGRGRKDLEMGS